MFFEFETSFSSAALEIRPNARFYSTRLCFTFSESLLVVPQRTDRTDRTDRPDRTDITGLETFPTRSGLGAGGRGRDLMA